MSKKLTKKEFIEKARQVHGDKYDYSKVEYINSNTKVCIICPEHGEFWQLPSNHLSGAKCPVCALSVRVKKRTMTKDEFIEKSKEIHSNKYDYSKVEYIDSQTPVCIICPKHEEFWQSPRNHLKGYGCKKCAYEITSSKLRSNTQDFIEKAHDIYGDYYDLSKVVYEKNSVKIIVGCPEHGDFTITPNDFLDGHGCPICGRKRAGEKLSNINQEEFIKRCKVVHGDKYDYSEAIYYRLDEKVKIKCPKHGEFWQTPHNHLRGEGCSKCARERRGLNCRLTTNDFIEKANKIHKNKYDYSKSVYHTGYDKICIICPKHGEFWQIAQDHLNGHGCSKCNTSTMEMEIMEMLQENNISFIYNKRYKLLEGLQLDFLLPDINVAIECQGKQHFEPVCFGGIDKQEAIDTFNSLTERDKRKKDLCDSLGVELLYFSNKEDIYPYKVFTDKNKLLNTINNVRKNTQDRLREIY